jgi:hypothetical protein
VTVTGDRPTSSTSVRPHVDDTSAGLVEALFKEAHQRRRRRRLAWLSVVVIVVCSAVGLLAVTRTTPNSPAHSAKVATPSSPALPSGSVSANVNLDITSAQTQVSVKLVENSPVVVRSASPSAGAAIAFPRLGYVLGSNAGGYVSLSNDLQKVLHVWSSAPGQYPAQAANPEDVWLSEPYGTSSHAQEFNMVEKAVAPAVAIPSGSIVLGQFGPVLVLQSAQPSSLLELWNPSTQTIVASLGPFDQLAVSPTSVAWTLTNSLDVATADGIVRRLPSGPAGDWATALAFSPTGSKLATVWAPSPPSERADSTESAAWHYRSLSLLDIGSGKSLTVPRSQGTTGPVTWNSDGTRIFFAQSSPAATSIGISTYRIGELRATKVDIPGLALPNWFGPPSGSLFVWDR